MADERKVMTPSVGTILKIVVTADIGNGMHLSDVDFSCAFFPNKYPNKRVNVTKDEMTIIDDDNYMAIVDSKIIGEGDYRCRLTAEVPDDNIPDGIRTEVVEFPVEQGKVVR